MAVTNMHHENHKTSTQINKQHKKKYQTLKIMAN